MIKKTLLMISFMVSSHAMAALPPQYLSVPDFKRCLSSQSKGTWQAWCVPKQKPTGCPQSSWDALMKDPSLMHCVKK